MGPEGGAAPTVRRTRVSAVRVDTWVPSRVSLTPVLTRVTMDVVRVRDFGYVKQSERTGEHVASKRASVRGVFSELAHNRGRNARCLVRYTTVHVKYISGTCQIHVDWIPWPDLRMLSITVGSLRKIP